MTHTKHPPSEVPSKSGLGPAMFHGTFLLLEKILRWCIHPRVRARLLRLCGAHIGRNVRVYEIQLFNLQHGFRNLHLADDVHVGPGCRLDLSAQLRVGARSTLSPGVTVLTHSDPGSTHGSKLLAAYPARFAPTSIEVDCWIGANATLLAGVSVADLGIVAAGAVVTCDVPTKCVVAGVPAHIVKELPLV